MIPNEAIDAAAEALFIRSLDISSTGSLREDARAALEAALPFLCEAARHPQRNTPTDWPDLPRARS